MPRRRCSKCGREEPTYIFDPHCPEAEGYCNFVELDARERSRHAWENWTEADIRAELAPWPR